MDPKIWILLWIAALCVTAIAAVVDYRTGQIPNTLTVGTLAIGPVLHVLLFTFLGNPAVGIVYHVVSVLSGALLCAAVPYALWLGGGLGGGDLKCHSTALGALLGLQRGLEVQLLAFSMALLLLPTVLAWQGRLRGTLRNAGRIVVNQFVREANRRPIAASELTDIRFGPAIFAGTLAGACLTWLR